MSKLRFLFRTPNHQRFDFKPRFWNPEEEEIKKRVERVERLKQGDTEALKDGIARGFRSGYHRGAASTRKQQAMRSNLILFGVIMALAVICYIFLNVYLPEFIDGLYNTPDTLVE